jgi:hypothetical protein
MRINVVSPAKIADSVDVCDEPFPGLRSVSMDQLVESTICSAFGNHQMVYGATSCQEYGVAATLRVVQVWTPVSACQRHCAE